MNTTRSSLDAPRIAAHLILGPRSEPFLGALLLSLEGSVQSIIVNDNSPDPSPHSDILQASSFARRGAMVVDRTPFTTFADARNICLRIHAETSAGEWAAFVDADEVHGAYVRRIASRLRSLPSTVGAVDAYTWHFFGSFDWYTSIERRMMFFRFSPNLYWERPVHEQLRGLRGERLVLPYVYAHYGHVFGPRRHAEKDIHYHSLGAENSTVEPEDLDRLDIERYFREYFPRMMHFRGRHPLAAQPTIEELRAKLRPIHAVAEEQARRQSAQIKLRNIVRSLNYAQRWRLRALNPAVWRLLQ